jgi:hypothetical protein
VSRCSPKIEIENHSAFFWICFYLLTSNCLSWEEYFSNLFLINSMFISISSSFCLSSFTWASIDWESLQKQGVLFYQNIVFKRITLYLIRVSWNRLSCKSFSFNWLFSFSKLNMDISVLDLSLNNSFNASIRLKSNGVHIKMM